MNGYIWVDGNDTEHTIYLSGVAGDLSVDSEDGWDDSNVELHIEASPNRYSSHYRGFSYRPREYVLTVTILTKSPGLLKGAQKDWKTWHSRELGEGYFKRFYLDEGGVQVVRCLDCIPGSAQWTHLAPGVARVVQRYVAAWPFWRDATASSAGDTMNGSTPVNVSCGNVGDIPAPIVAVFTGICHTPKLTNSDGHYLELDKETTNADDTLTTDTRSRGSTKRYSYFLEHGAGTAEAVSATSGSRPITLPLGTNNLAVVGASGETSTAVLSVAWHNYYESLF